VSLPCFPRMTADEVDTVAAALATIHAEGLA
jgi:dTDP-4-amino-4,6-dideoxygalactose transaminase